MAYKKTGNSRVFGHVVPFNSIQSREDTRRVSKYPVVQIPLDISTDKIIFPIFNGKPPKIGKFKSAQKTILELKFDDPNEFNRNDRLNGLLPYFHPFHINDILRGAGKTLQEQYFESLEDVTGVKYKGNIPLFNQGLNEVIGGNRFFVSWSIYESVENDSWFIGPDGDNMAIGDINGQPLNYNNSIELPLIQLPLVC